MKAIVLLGALCLTGCDVALAVGLIVASRDDDSDDPPPVPLPVVEVTATDDEASEQGGNTGEFTITRTGSTAADLDVFFTLATVPPGQATPGADYADIGTQVTIPAGFSSVTIPVTPIDDVTAEGPETVVLTITAAATYQVEAPGNATVTIDDDDDARYHVWVADLTSGEASAEETALQTGGNPGAAWTEVGTGTATAEFNPAASATSINTILIQVTNAQIYDIDAIEVMDANGTVVEWVTGTVYKARMTNADNTIGTPDGVPAVTAATAGNKAVLFARFTGLAGIESFRVNIRAPGVLASGDLEWVRTLTRTTNQSAGGAAISSAGTLYASFHDDATRDIQVVRYDASGVESAITTFATGVTATVGSHSVAIDDANSAVYVAGTVAAGDIGIEKYSLAMVDSTPGAGSYFFKTSFAGAERVEANGLALDGNGEIIVAGGAKALLTADIDHWMMKVDTGGGQAWIVAPTAPSDGANSWWHGVVVGGGNHLYAAGDLTQAGSLEVLTGRVTSAGGADWNVAVSNAGQVDRGNSIAVDSGDNLIVGGFQTISAQGKNGFIQRYTNAGGAIGSAVTYNGVANGDDEILDIAVDPSDDGIYAVGYETVTGQGTNMWIRKYNSAGSPVWTRTHHAGTGDDRAVSVVLSGDYVLVVGDVTIAGPEKEIHVRKYHK